MIEERNLARWRIKRKKTKTINKKGRSDKNWDNEQNFLASAHDFFQEQNNPRMRILETSGREFTPGRI